MLPLIIRLLTRKRSAAGILLILCTTVFAIILSGCTREKSADEPMERHVYAGLSKRVTTLDPALAADSTSQYVAAALYDTLLQYEYRPGEYTLIPSMLEKMPEVNPDQTELLCTLRKDLYFQESPAFAGLSKEARHITSRDVVFSMLRLADARLQSPGYWVVRDRILGIEDFYKATEKAPAGDYSVYDAPCPGFEILDDYHFKIHLSSPNPRMLYSLALPYCSVVSRRALEYFGSDFQDHPCGSGPFSLELWEKDYQMVLKANPDFREEYYSWAETPDETRRKLPLSEKITIYFVKQPLSSWLMFLQGELDFYALDGDNFEAVVSDSLQLSPALLKRGISMLQAPELQTNYIGFNFADPLLAENADLRRAISLAFDKDLRVIHSGGRFVPASGPIPPGTPGYVADPGKFGRKNLDLAREYLRKAGYPDGIDPETGEPLTLTFDQTGSGTLYTQIAELLSEDMSKIGIRIRPEFNTRPRFLQKVRNGSTQLFRFSWTGDYPDGENFLQLFYGPNAGSCNRVLYRDPAYDAMYEEILSMPDSPERTAKYEAMSRYLMDQCPWIFETYTMAFVLKHAWMHNYMPHDFAFNRWKYLSVDPEKRMLDRKNFKPLSMSELRKN